ncbi:WD repeat-containing protein 49, partial [Varanus komodoensis]
MEEENDVWNIEDHSCLLTFIPKVSQIRGEMETCYFSPDLQALYIAAENFGLLKFQHREGQIHVSGMSHNGPVFCCQYNKQLQHVVSCSEDSVIKVWNLKNGQLVIKVHETHGGTAITCMALDANGKRLITGGRDGNLKRWDCCTLSYLDTIKQATSSADEVIACTYTNIYNNSYIISVGWDRKIHAFLDINDEVTKESGSQMDWIENVQHGHKEDILCVAACPPHFLATSSFDGEILIWNLVSGHLCSRLHATSNAAMKGEVEDLAINKIIFLVSRLEKKRTAAILVASGPRGYITFWNIYGRGKQFANFCSCEERSTISDLAVSDNDSLLCTGDQQGCLCIWNMVDYAMNGPEVDPPACKKKHFVTLVSEDQLLLTSSLDNSVKLWSLEGEYIGMFGQREPWNIKEKSSWKQSKCNVNSENASESDVKGTTENIAAQREYYSMLNAEMVQDTSALKIDDEITEELKQRQTRRLKHRSKQYQVTPFQEHASKVMNSYHSLPLCELVCVSTAFHKPDLAAQLDDLFSDGNLIVSWNSSSEDLKKQ